MISRELITFIYGGWAGSWIVRNPLVRSTKPLFILRVVLKLRSTSTVVAKVFTQTRISRILLNGR